MALALALAASSGVDGDYLRNLVCRSPRRVQGAPRHGRKCARRAHATSRPNRRRAPSGNVPLSTRGVARFRRKTSDKFDFSFSFGKSFHLPRRARKEGRKEGAGGRGSFCLLPTHLRMSGCPTLMTYRLVKVTMYSSFLLSTVGSNKSQVRFPLSSPFHLRWLPRKVGRRENGILLAFPQ